MILFAPYAGLLLPPWTPPGSEDTVPETHSEEGFTRDQGVLAPASSSPRLGLSAHHCHVKIRQTPTFKSACGGETLPKLQLLSVAWVTIVTSTGQASGTALTHSQSVVSGLAAVSTSPGNLGEINAKFLGPNSHLLNRRSSGWDPAICILTSPQGGWYPSRVRLRPRGFEAESLEGDLE